VLERREGREAGMKGEMAAMLEDLKVREGAREGGREGGRESVVVTVEEEWGREGEREWGGKSD
jgi:hypothetical protein